MFSRRCDDVLSEHIFENRSVPSLDLTFGAVLIGTYVGLLIYGFNLHQAFRYNELFPRDQMHLKVLVSLVLWVLTINRHPCPITPWLQGIRDMPYDIVYMHQVVLEKPLYVLSYTDERGSYHYLVANHDNPIRLLFGVCIINRAIDLLPICTGLSITTCQTFFIRRVYILVCGRLKLLVAPVVVSVLGELAFAAAATGEALSRPTFAEYRHVMWMISVAFGMAVLSDGILTTVLIRALRRSRTGIKSVFDTLGFMFTIFQPNYMIFIGIQMVATKLYATSFFAALNSRHTIMEQNKGALATIYGESSVASPYPAPITFDQWTISRAGIPGPGVPCRMLTMTFAFGSFVYMQGPEANETTDIPLTNIHVKSDLQVRGSRGGLGAQMRLAPEQQSVIEIGSLRSGTHESAESNGEA
ncbi:hypothetical protein BD414DRAFT_530927 [Trametes punicea]|nr:hypothetical protein BD414DRAFT_530927 [Trametes punicea]